MRGTIGNWTLGKLIHYIHREIKKLLPLQLPRHAPGNLQTLESVTIPNNSNAVLYGPVSVDTDRQIVVGTNSILVIQDI